MPSFSDSFNPVWRIFIVLALEFIGQIHIVSYDFPAGRGTAFTFKHPVVGGNDRIVESNLVT